VYIGFAPTGNNVFCLAHSQDLQAIYAEGGDGLLKKRKWG